MRKHTHMHARTHINTQSTSLLTGQAFSALSHAVFNWPHTGSLAVPNALLPPTTRESMNACKYAHSFPPLLLCHTTALNAIFCFSATQTFHRNVSAEGKEFGHTSNLFKTLICRWKFCRAPLWQPHTSTQFLKLSVSVRRAESKGFLVSTINFFTPSGQVLFQKHVQIHSYQLSMQFAAKR